MAYYTICTPTDGKLYPQFGDRDRQVVLDEKRDAYARQGAVIVKSKTAHQRDVNAAIEAANAKVAK